MQWLMYWVGARNGNAQWKAGDCVVRQLKRDFPSLTIVLNGGLVEWEAIERELAFVDGVMLGRAAYHDPYLLSEVDRRLSAGGRRREWKRDPRLQLESRGAGVDRDSSAGFGHLDARRGQRGRPAMEGQLVPAVGSHRSIRLKVEERPPDAAVGPALGRQRLQRHRPAGAVDERNLARVGHQPARHRDADRDRLARSRAAGTGL